MNNYLYHHGVKGMKWGRRKQRVTNGSSKNRSRKTKYKAAARGVGRLGLAMGKATVLGAVGAAAGIGLYAGGYFLGKQATKFTMSAIRNGSSFVKSTLKNSGATNYSSIANKTKAVTGYLRNLRRGVTYF